MSDTALDIIQVMQILKHRYPFLLVDRILEFDGDHAVGLKNVTINEPFFQGHFPGEPVMPGVLIIEAMGQVGSIMTSAHMGEAEAREKIVFLTGINNAKIRKPVRPGDRLILHAEMIKLRGRVGKASCKAFVDETLVAEAEFQFIVGTTLKKEDETKAEETNHQPFSSETSE
jgi:3-hydroxyacyl-[acyl-carrier-protein] dehydratase